MGKLFKLVSPYKPTGDQPEAIKRLVEGINSGKKCQTLMGVTGSGKTFTMANVIDQTDRPTLVLAHNKTLAAQLCAEFRDFFPENAVEYFVSYYDYYQPESYMPMRDMYIEKDCDINEEIDRLRHSATNALLERRDVIIVASVSCIYGLGSPEDYKDLMLSLRPGMTKSMDSVMERLVQMQYVRNEVGFNRGSFRKHGDTIEVFPSYSSTTVIRIEFFGDEIERIREVNYITGEVLSTRNYIGITPASHHATSKEKIEKAIDVITSEMEMCRDAFKENNKYIEAQRIEERTLNDMEMLTETGTCKGIENYSRPIGGRPEGSAPYTLLDYFPKDFIMFIDESHVTVPQVSAMYNGDRARKDNLVQYGFRLPSAYDNRPLRFQEFEERIKQVVFVSATPSKYEKEHSENTVEQVIRPTGLIDPEVIVRPVKRQVDDLINEIEKVTAGGERVLVTTLTKKMAEDLTEYLSSLGIKVKYLHSEIVTLQRSEIIQDLRRGEFDVLVGINLLREGLDLPEVSLIAILDADKEGFLRSETSLIQTIGRAARNVHGRVIMYGDTITESMRRAIEETNRRRKIQTEYNEAHGITPQSIIKEVKQIIETTKVAEDTAEYGVERLSKDEINEMIRHLTEEMRTAAKEERFEAAAIIRDKIMELKGELIETAPKA